MRSADGGNFVEGMEEGRPKRVLLDKGLGEAFAE
jgi:hypothetical protein